MCARPFSPPWPLCSAPILSSFGDWITCLSAWSSNCLNNNRRGGGEISLKGSFAKNKRGYRLTAKNIRWGSLLILLLCYVYKEKVLKTTHTEELASIKFRKLQYSTNWVKMGGQMLLCSPPPSSYGHVTLLCK